MVKNKYKWFMHMGKKKEVPQYALAFTYYKEAWNLLLFSLSNNQV